MGRAFLATGILTVVLTLTACGSGGSTSTTTPTGAQFSLVLASSTLTAYPSAAASTLAFTTPRSGSTATLSVSVSGLPTGATAAVTSPGTGTTGEIAIQAGTTAAGSYALSVLATDGTNTVTQPLTLTVGVVAVVSSTATGTLNEAMSTSFQIASWTDSLFTDYPGIPAQLTTLGSKHIRMQVMGTDIPETAAGVWNFTTLDKSVQPILTASDQSPEFQVAYAPTYLYNGASSGFVTSQAGFLPGYADYAAKLVSYYNKGGFTVNGTIYASPSTTPITYWGIYNEPNINGVSASEYVQLYNTAVPAMQAVDPSLKFVALELSDWGTQEQLFVPTFVQNVTAPVDVMATHFYSTCNQSDTDTALMATIPTFASGVEYIYQQLATKPALANVPVWILENNVNADYNNNGMSACQPSQKFVTDARGSSAFFAGWRTYEFSKLGKAGAHALYHWDFAADAQYGEFNTSTGKRQLSFWVDYWLGKYFPPSEDVQILTLTNSDANNVEVLAVKRTNGQVLVMISDHAVASSTDNNGAGQPRTVNVDISSLGTFTTAKQLTLDASTDPVNGPTEQTVTFAPQMTVTLGGYGASFLTLQ